MTVRRARVTLPAASVTFSRSVARTLPPLWKIRLAMPFFEPDEEPGPAGARQRRRPLRHQRAAPAHELPADRARLGAAHGGRHAAEEVAEPLHASQPDAHARLRVVVPGSARAGGPGHDARGGIAGVAERVVVRVHLILVRGERAVVRGVRDVVVVVVEVAGIALLVEIGVRLVRVRDRRAVVERVEVAVAVVVHLAVVADAVVVVVGLSRVRLRTAVVARVRDTVCVVVRVAGVALAVAIRVRLVAVSHGRAVVRSGPDRSGPIRVIRPVPDQVAVRVVGRRRDRRVLCPAHRCRRRRHRRRRTCRVPRRTRPRAPRQAQPARPARAQGRSRGLSPSA